MTTTDSTGEKLVASIRRSKRGATSADPDRGPGPGSATRATPVPSPASAGAHSVSASKGGVRDPYRSPGRVWPD